MQIFKNSTKSGYQAKSLYHEAQTNFAFVGSFSPQCEDVLSLRMLFLTWHGKAEARRVNSWVLGKHHLHGQWGLSLYFPGPRTQEQRSPHAHWKASKLKCLDPHCTSLPLLCSPLLDPILTWIFWIGLQDKLRESLSLGCYLPDFPCSLPSYLDVSSGGLWRSSLLGPRVLSTPNKPSAHEGERGPFTYFFQI